MNFAPEAWPTLPRQLVVAIMSELGLPDWLVGLAGGLASAGVVVGVFMTLFALLSLIERKTLARAQNRPGPNRAGPFGLFQPVADGIKMLTKEDIVPRLAEKFLHLLAPVLIVVPAVLALGVLPLGREWVAMRWDLGLVFFFAVGSLTELAVFIAGWASGSKFPMLGAMRAIAQMVSYELPLLICALPVVMLAGTLSLPGIVEAQGGFALGVVPKWFIFTPWGLVGGAVFFIAAIAEANRCPFDLPEGESEIVAGHMTEYSGFKYALFFIGEYLGLFAISGLGVTLFLGGWQAPLPGLGFVPTWFWFFSKVWVLIFVFLWIRSTYPRLRMDQLMSFAWLGLLPSAMLTIPAAALWKFSGHAWWSWPVVLGLTLIPYAIATWRFNHGLAPANRTYHFADS